MSTSTSKEFFFFFISLIAGLVAGEISSSLRMVNKFSGRYISTASSLIYSSPTSLSTMFAGIFPGLNPFTFN